MEGGKVKKVAETGAPVGSMITVEHLFFNTPARRKFLKSTSTEIAHILDTLSSIALGWPQVQFSLTHNGKAVKSWPPALGYYDRAVDVMGQELHNRLLNVTFDDGYLSLEGFVSSPDITRASTQKIFLYINGRYIRDRSLIHALIDAYGSRLMKGRFPIAVLFLKIPFDQLDVNVHPTKHEVRFVDHSRIYTSVKATVAGILQHSEKKAVRPMSPLFQRKSDLPYKTPEARNLYFHPVQPAPTIDTVHENPNPMFQRKEQISEPRSPAPSCAPEPSDRFSGNDQGPVETRTGDTSFFSALRIIGQLHNSYILCDSGEGLIIIDQHAAHERIVFEELKKKTTGVQSQALLLPETVELGYKEAEALESALPDLAGLGLDIEPFGGNCFAVKSVPAILSTGMITRLVIEIAEKLVEIGSSKVLENALDDCLILMSCHGAVRANQALSERQISHLLNQLDQCDSPSFCPHGRPTWTRFSMQTIEKTFKR